MHIRELQNLEGESAVVIGGAGYLGSAITETLLELGANCLVVSRNAETNINKFQESFNGMVRGLNADISKRKDRDRITKEIIDEYGKINILVNCSWNGEKSSLELITEEQWDHDIDVCLSSVFKITRQVMPLLLKGGRVLNVASMYGHLSPNPMLYKGNKFTNPPSYGAAKAGIIQLTKYCAVFMADHGIRVNCISPGPFPFVSTQSDEGFINKLGSLNPLNRIGQPDEMKGAVALLCTRASSYMTGQNLCVDGGWGIW